MNDRSPLPAHAGQLVWLAVDILRIEQDLPSATKAALRRWAESGKSPRARKRSRHVHTLVDVAVPSARFASLFGLDRADAVADVATGLEQALAAFDHADLRASWLASLAVTVGVVMARTGARGLRRVGNESAAKAPSWMFSGRRPNPTRDGVAVVRAASERVADTLRNEARADLDGRLRKNLTSTAVGRGVHRNTLDDIARRSGRPLFPFEWALEELILRFHVDVFSSAFILNELDCRADALAALAADDELFRNVLRGAAFSPEWVAVIRAATENEGEQS